MRIKRGVGPVTSSHSDDWQRPAGRIRDSSQAQVLGPETTPQADDTFGVSNLESHPNTTASPIEIELSALFGFTVGYWSKTAELTSSCGVRVTSRIAMSWFLDTMDASGKLNMLHVAVDGMSEAVLMSN